MVDSTVSVNGKGEFKEELMANSNETEKKLEEPPVHELNLKTELNTELSTPQAWKWSVMFLCFYGFMVQLKPGESFITPYLLSTEKNFTREQVGLKRDSGLGCSVNVQSICICINFSDFVLECCQFDYSHPGFSSLHSPD